MQSTVSGEKQEPRFANNITVITTGGRGPKTQPCYNEEGVANFNFPLIVFVEMLSFF